MKIITGNLLVSIIMPMFNSERFVGETIRSLLAQTYDNWELIVIDDGSTDSSAVIVKGFQDPRIRYYFQDNLGVKRLAETMNVGLSKIEGELVTMLPSDDVWPDYRLQSQVHYFDDPGLVLCFGKQHLIDVQGDIIGETKLPKKMASKINDPVGSALNEMFVWNYIPQPTVLIRAKSLMKIGGYLQPDDLFAEDYPTHMALAFEGRFQYVDKVLAYYRLHPHQMTRTHYLEMAESDAKYVVSFYDDLTEEQKFQTGWNRNDLVIAMDKRASGAYFVVGRQLLLDKKWRKARTYFYEALLHGNWEAKSKSILGLGCAVLHVDMEMFTKFSRRAARLK
jgi:glycosyltransferase involved in cell wall biosynthesis